MPLLRVTTRWLCTCCETFSPFLQSIRGKCHDLFESELYGESRITSKHTSNWDAVSSSAAQQGTYTSAVAEHCKHPLLQRRVGNCGHSRMLGKKPSTSQHTWRTMAACSHQRTFHYVCALFALQVCQKKTVWWKEKAVKVPRRDAQRTRGGTRWLFVASPWPLVMVVLHHFVLKKLKFESVCEVHWRTETDPVRESLELHICCGLQTLHQPGLAAPSLRCTGTQCLSFCSSGASWHKSCSTGVAVPDGIHHRGAQPCQRVRHFLEPLQVKHEIVAVWSLQCSVEDGLP